jgi:hypothetical protein
MVTIPRDKNIAEQAVCSSCGMTLQTKQISIVNSVQTLSSVLCAVPNHFITQFPAIKYE